LSSQILVIDDETNIRTMIRIALEHSGFDVDTASDGEEGLKKAAAKHYDLVLVDQRMPGITGIEVQQKLNKSAPDTHVILITAFGTIDLALDSIHGGASDFLRKPFTAETLRSAVKSALSHPAKKLLAVPIGLVCREFTRTTINGFSFDVDPEANEEHGPVKEVDKTAGFLVRHGEDRPTNVKVTLPSYVMELVKAYIDSEEVPGEDSFWLALCEEALANYLWQNAAIPEGAVLRIEDLSSNLQRWLDNVLTVEMQEHAV